jgi:hypothetical protein
LYMEDKFRYALTDVRKNAAIDTTQFVPDGAPPATIR